MGGFICVCAVLLVLNELKRWWVSCGDYALCDILSRHCAVLCCPCLSCRDQSSFFEDKGIEPRFRSRLDDFKDSGYDRGHMVRL